MSQYMWGYGRGKVSRKESKRIDEICGTFKGVAFTNPTLHGSGPVYWFEGPNRGHPFDGQLSREVANLVGEVQHS